MNRCIGVLAPTQAIGSTPRQFVDRESAKFLLDSLVAEKISNRVIRFFAAESPFRKVNPTRYIPSRLPSREIRGVKFITPSLRHRRDVVVVGALTRIWLREISARQAN